MSWTQVLTPSPSVPCTPGWCLKYVSDAFGVSNIPHTNYPSATAAWSASIQHQDQAFPVGMWVPVWFSLRDEPNGHVALRAPDGSVYSSSDPNTNVPHHHPSLAALIAYYARANPLTYLGWSEDIGGTAVITQDGDTIMITDSDNEYGRWNKLGYQIRGRQMSRDEFRQAAVGQTWLHAMEILSDNTEADTATRAQEIGQMAVHDNWEGQIHTLETQLDTANKTAASQTTQFTDAQKQLDTEKAKSAGLAKNLDDSQLELKDAKDQLAQAESLAHDDDAKIKDLTAQLSAAQAQITTLTAQADKPPAHLQTSSTTPTAQTDSTQNPNLLSNLLGVLVSFLKGGK